MNRISASVRLLSVAVLVGASVGLAHRAEAATGFCPAQPPPGLCSDAPGIPGFTPGFSIVPGVPGTWGPTGAYTPIQGGVATPTPKIGGELP